MRPHHRFWLWPNLLSLDAPLVAVLWQVFFLRCFRAPGEILPSVLLVSAVWLIYTADRALDAWRGAGDRPRHQFYQRHWRVVLPAWAGVLALTGWLAFTSLAPHLFRRGMFVLGAVILYFAAVHAAPARLRAKEAAVAVLFALGVSVAAWGHVKTRYDVLTVLLFSCLCWINCIAIEQWEREDEWERKDEWERRGGGPWPVAITAACVGFAAILLLHQTRPILGGAEAASAAAFILLDRTRPRLSADALRVLADAALLSPILFLPLAGIRV